MRSTEAILAAIATVDLIVGRTGRRKRFLTNGAGIVNPWRTFLSKQTLVRSHGVVFFKAFESYGRGLRVMSVHERGDTRRTHNRVVRFRDPFLRLTGREQHRPFLCGDSV